MTDLEARRRARARVVTGLIALHDPDDLGVLAENVADVLSDLASNALSLDAEQVAELLEEVSSHLDDVAGVILMDHVL